MTDTLKLSTLFGAAGFDLEGVAPGDRTGASVSGAGDVNGDGVDDLIVGAPGAAPGGVSSAGSSYVVFGRSDGFDATVDLAALDGTDGFRLDGVGDPDQSGGSVAAAGDVDGDGIGDLIVGASRADVDGLGAAGAAYVVYGRSDGFAPVLDLGALDGSDGSRLGGTQTGAFTGRSVAAAGDVNGDGIDDVIVGASQANPGPSSATIDAGSSYVVFGRPGGFGATFDLGTLDGTSGVRLDGVGQGENSGTSVSGAGDVNGDGFADLIVGAPDAASNAFDSGSSYVVFGRGSGFGATLDLATLDGSSGFRLDGGRSRDSSGTSVSGAGDVNGDGFADVIVGAFEASAGAGRDAGRSYVVFGAASGFAPTVDLDALDGTDGFRLDGESRSDRSGFAVSGAGDVDGDGFDDLIVGARGADFDGMFDVGASYVLRGGSGPFAPAIGLGDLASGDGLRIVGEAGGDESGFSVSGAGDVDGDGFDDLIVGTRPREGAGAAYVVFGRSDLAPVGTLSLSVDRTAIAEAGGTATVTVTRNAPDLGAPLIVALTSDDATEAALPGSVTIAAGEASATATVTGRDDTRADGTQTVTLRADAAFLGTAVATLDVTDDEIPTPRLDLGALDGTDGFRLSGAPVSAGAGRSVSGAGDVNGDGIADVVVGTSGAEGGAGAGYVVFGTRGGFDASVDLAALDGTTGFRLDAAEAGDGAGFSVSDAGDVNGDGIADLIVGAVLADPGGIDDAGAAYVLYGSDEGFAASVDLGALDGTDGFRLDGVAAIDFTGFSVSGAGDVNGDGLDDVVVGAVSADVDMRSNAGSGYVVFGATGGVAAVRDLGALDGTDGFRFDGSGSNDQTGRSVSGAGDVNGDGFADVVIGAPFAETANVVFGSAAGFDARIASDALDGANGFRIEGPGGAETELVGWSVSAAGDVDGDGIDDLLLGTALGDVETDDAAGASYLVYGRRAGFGATLDPTALDAASGTRFGGAGERDFAGRAVAAAGDVNGDGIGDLIVGAEFAGGGGDGDAGAAFLVFGRAGGFDAAEVDLGTLTPDQGLRLDGAADGDGTGRSVSAAGDVNGDGFDDVIVGAPGADLDGPDTGAGYVVFGRASFAPELSLSLDASSIAEAGGAATMTVMRDGDTSRPLTVALASDDSSEATLPATVTIAAGAASATATVSAVDDALADGPQSVGLAASAGGFAGAATALTVTDDEVPTLSVAFDPPADGGPIGENGGSAVLRVSRNTEDLTGPLTVALTSSDPGEAVVEATVTILAGDREAAATILAQDDAVADGTQAVTFDASAAGFVGGSAVLDVTDDEAPALAVSVVPGAISENGGTAVLTVSRNVEDLGTPLTVALASDDAGEASVPAGVVIAAGATSATAVVTGVDDGAVDGAQAVGLTATAAGFADGTATVAVTDDEVAALSLTIVPGSVLEGGAVATATITRNTVDLSQGLAVTIEPGDRIEAIPAEAFLAPGERTATVDLRAIDDGALNEEGAGTASVSISADGFVGASATVEIVDDERPLLAVEPGDVALSEDGTVELTLTRSVTTAGAALPLTVALDNGDPTQISVPSEVTFAAGETVVSFSVSGIEDAVAEDVKIVAVTPVAAQFEVAGTTITLADDDAPALSLALDSASISEAGGVATLTVTRNVEDASQALKVTLASDDASEASVPATVTIAAGAASAVAVVTGVDDAVVDGDQAVGLTAAAAGFADATARVTVADDDVAAPADPFRVEAETFEIVSGFAVASNPHPSGGQFLQATGSGEARASYAFGAAAGTYDLTLGYFDESDGRSTLSVVVDGEAVETFVWDDDPAGPLADPTSQVERVVEGVTLAAGSVVELVGTAQGGEPLRTDYVDFAPASGADAAPRIVSPGAVTAAENQRFALDVRAVDDASAEGAGLSYAITGGVDAGLFGIDAGTGVVRFAAAPDFEAPGDADGDGVYALEVTVTDAGGLTDVQAVAVTVADVAEDGAVPAPFRVEAETFRVVSDFVAASNPNASGGAFLQSGGSGLQRADMVFGAASGTYDLTVGYFDESDGASTLTVSVNGVAVDVFTWDADAGGAFASPDARAERVIEDVALTTGDVVEIAGRSDGGEPLRTDYVDFAFDAGPAANARPVLAGPSAYAVAEGRAVVADLQASDDRDAEGAGLGYRIAGGADAAAFRIDAGTGVLTFAAAPDFEMAGDADGDNVYAVRVAVTDRGGLSAARDLAVTVRDVDEAVVGPDPFRVEAEAFEALSGFAVQANPNASGSAFLQASGTGATGGVSSASYAFGSVAGVYDLALSYFDENDGRSSLAVLVDGTEVDAFVWDADPAGPFASPDARVTRTIEEVMLAPGMAIEIVGSADGGEPLRVDSLDVAFQEAFAADGAPVEPI